MTTIEDTEDRIAEDDLRDRVRDVAIEQVGSHGFRTSLRAIAVAAGISQEVLLDLYGSKRQLMEACDNYIVESIRASKSQALQSHDAATWLSAMSEIESYAPMMAYLVRSMDEGGPLGHALLDQMIANAVGYLEDGVRAGTVKPSRNPKARATFLALNNAGGFLLYRRRHATPADMRAVLRDYAADMIAPALELYTEGLLADPTMRDALIANSRA